ncbi:hypothetical protein AAEX28_02860 [Lentisphaerota bacterium WC36G]|nr:hypothetical protein LJT99_05740 [Lentisphaerae bacterium WC36]
MVAEYNTENNSDNDNKYLEIAEAMVATAQDNDFLHDSMGFIPEIFASEKDLISAISSRLREYIEMKGTEELSEDDLLSMFSFVVAKSAEVISKWRCNQEFDFNTKGLFSGSHELYADGDLLRVLKSVPVAETLFSAFSEWHSEHPEFCTQNNVHPILPVLEALKWTYRIAVNMTLEFFERQSSNN